MQALWDDVIASLKGKTSEQTYIQWFKQIDYVGRDDSNIELRVPNAFIRDWLKEHYRGLIETTVEEITGESLRAVFHVGARPVGTPAPVADATEPGPRPEDLRDRKRRMNGEEPNYDAKLTLANFVVDDGNRIAHAAAAAISKKPGEGYNPLFLHAPTGLGKTHLLHGIAQAVARGYGSARARGGLQVKLMTTEAFVNDLVGAIRTSKMYEFRKAYRDHCDVLLIDDIHFIGGKGGSQEEFFHTFDALIQAGRQIVITSDRPPSEIAHLDKRLQSRFESAMVVEIKPPRFETRVAILQKRAKLEKIELPDDVAEYIAARVDTNVRALVGCLLRLGGLSQLTHAPITLAMAQEHLADQLQSQSRQVTPEMIMRLVCQHFSVRMTDVRGKSRVKKVLVPRQIAMYLMRNHTQLSLQEIGARFGGKDHSTVISSIRKITDMRDGEAEMNQTLRRLEMQLVS